MKLRLASVISMLVIITFAICGCNTQNDPIIDTTSDTITQEQTSNVEKADYNKIYSDTINKFTALFTTDDTDDSEGTLGVNEIINMRGKKEAAANIGYSIKDISGDDIPELIIGFIDEANKGSEILALYTCKAAKPVFVFESMTRSAYFITNDGNLFYQGSAGAMYSIFASYTLNGTELVCNDYWFTHEKDKDSFEIGYYHNTTGELDKSVSEELNISEDEFYEKQSDLIAKKSTISLTPFSTLIPETQKKASKVTADYTENVDLYTQFNSFTADESEYATKILFMADGEVTDFCFLSLTIKDVDENGKMTFDTETLYSLDTLEETTPLEVTMTFYGDIPSYGISYTDAQGTTKSYAISISGEDGSVVLSEF